MLCVCVCACVLSSLSLSSLQMPIAHNTLFTTSCLLALLAHLEDVAKGETKPEPLTIGIQHRRPLSEGLRGHRAIELPCPAVPPEVAPVFVYKKTEARSIKSHIPNARVIDPREWKQGLVSPPRLVFVDPLFAKSVGGGRHTVRLGGNSVVRLAHKYRPTTQLSCLYGVHSKEGTTTVSFGYSDMAPVSLKKNIMAVLKRSKALLGKAERDVESVWIRSPSSTPIEIVGALADEMIAEQQKSGLLEKGVDSAEIEERSRALSQEYAADSIVVKKRGTRKRR